MNIFMAQGLPQLRATKNRATLDFEYEAMSSANY